MHMVSLTCWRQQAGPGAHECSAGAVPKSAHTLL